ncbi:MAG: choice-of-anchor L domain-containing protein, partial [Bacteroidota bacterium]
STQNDPLFTADPGDPDLQYLSDEFGGGSTTYDVCSVELDVFAATNEVVFEYVFGSEEYPEFVWAFGGYNDIFAFLVSGPGIAGDPNLTNSALNIATLPTTGTLVQIDSVNNQVNWEYYRNNEIGQELQYDGLTSDILGVKKSLTARVPVTPCNTYHLKLAIADRGDESYDSGVFVSEIRAGSPDLDIAFSSGLDYFIETCTGTNDTLFITLNKLPTVATSFNVTLGGTATQDEDYELNIPPAITFQPGQQTLAFPI